MNNIHLTERIRTYWIYMLFEHWDAKDTPYSDDFDFCPDFPYQYFNELPLDEAIEIDYLTWKSE